VGDLVECAACMATHEYLTVEALSDR